MTDEQTSGNAAVVRRLYDEVWNGRNFEVLKEIAHPHVAEVLEKEILDDRQKFDDLVITPVRILAEGDFVHSMIIARGVHAKPFTIAGVSIEASKKPFGFSASEEFEFREGRIVGRVYTTNLLPVLLNAGAIKPATAPIPPSRSKGVIGTWLALAAIGGAIVSGWATASFGGSGSVSDEDRCYHAMSIESSMAYGLSNDPPDPSGSDPAVYASALAAWEESNALARADIEAAAADVAEFCG